MTALGLDINLLPKSKWEKGFVGKLLFWALNVGRYVVVFTELIVIGAFLFRFGLDKRLTDLNFEINQKKNAVMTYGDLEAKWRRLQSQLGVVAKFQTEAVDANQVLNAISQITPLDTSYTTITLNAKKVVLEGQTLSNVGLATLLTKAQSQPLFKEVTLETVSSSVDQSGVITFRLTLTL